MLAKAAMTARTASYLPTMPLIRPLIRPLMTTSLTALLSLTAGSALAQVRWTDADGRVHYGDVAPPGARSAPVPSRLSTTPGQAGVRSTADQEKDFQKRQKDAEDAERKQSLDAENAQERLRACNQARGVLAAIEAGGRMVRYSPTGERIFLDEAGVAAERAQAQKVVAAACGQGSQTPASAQLAVPASMLGSAARP
jgi:hypothetical protein